MTEQIQINFESPAAGGMTNLETRVLSLIQRGRENAISMPALAAGCGISTRELQSIVKHLIEEHGVLIASATGKNHGYYYPETEEEFRAAADQLVHRIISLAKRLRAMNKESYERIFGQGRMEL
jgi:biotin operon repressor